MTNLDQTDTGLPALSSFRSWWNKVVPLRVKYLVIVATCVLTLVAAFQWQTSKLSDIRAQDLKDNQTTQCYTRVESRDDLRAILFYVVDLSDIIPDSEAAELYTLNRTTFINHNYPALSGERCPIDGLTTPVITLIPDIPVTPTTEVTVP